MGRNATGSIENEPRLEGVPPQAIDAERAVLGAILQAGDNDVPFATASGILEPDAFYIIKHKNIFQACHELFSLREPIDLVTVTQRLQLNGKLEDVGGVPFVNNLIDSCPSAANVEWYSNEVHKAYIKRRLRVESTKISVAANDDTQEADAVLALAEESIMSIRQDRSMDRMVSIKQSVTTTIKEIQELYQKGESVIGLPSGYSELDKITSGFQRSQYIIIAGRPGMGKSTIIQNLLDNVCIEQGTGGVMFSLETSKEAFTRRLLSQESEIPLQDLRTGYLSENRWSELATAAARIEQSPLWIDDTGGIKASEIRAKLYQAQRHINIGVVVIDYIQLMGGEGRSETRNVELGNISKSLKALAQEFECPFIVCSQLSRSVESREDKRPKLHDLRECVTGDTLIPIETGAWVRVDSLSGNERIATMDQHYKLKWQRPTFVRKTGVKAIFQVETRTGKRIKASSNHPFMTINGWVNLEDLSVGDTVATIRRIKPVTSDSVSTDISRFLGYMIGDGSYLRHREVSFTNKDEGIIEDVKRIVKTVIGHVGIRETRRNGACKLEFSRAKVSDLLGKPIRDGKHNRARELIREWGIFGESSYNKRVPQRLFRLDNSCIASFIAGLIMTDGCIVPRQQGASWHIKYASVCRPLLEDLSQLLLRLGVNCVIDKGYMSKKATVPLFNVQVNGIDALKLLYAIQPFLYGAKYEKSVRAIEALDKCQNRNMLIDRLPIEITHYVKDNRQGMSWTELGYRCQNKRMSRETATMLGRKLDEAWLVNLGYSDILWDKVTSIVPLGSDTVYDLSMEGTHNFVANSFIVHNSGNLEQDADLVMFLYRESYYDKSLDSMITELNIEKHKDGPCGRVMLDFDPTTMTFNELVRNTNV